MKYCCREVCCVGSVAETTTECQPLAPSGTVLVRFSVWTSPVPSVARTVRVWPPGVAFQG
ncbi:hypothetical protein SMICM304S_02729 [Streptomyces microflavus]